jgi:hypothetical protein
MVISGSELSGADSLQFDFPCSRHHYQIDVVGACTWTLKDRT